MRREIKRLGGILCMAVVGLTPVVANAALVLNDNFDSYTNGNLVGQGGWTQSGATATSPIQVAGGVDKYAAVGTSGQDVYKAFSTGISHVDGDDLQTSIEIFMTAAQAIGDYFYHVSDPVGTTSNFYQRLFAKSSGAGFLLGVVGTSGGTINYGTTVLNFNQTYDVDIDWNFIAGPLNDTIDVTVDSTAYVSHTWDSPTAEPLSITAANLRQGTAGNAPTVQVDQIVVDGDTFVPEPGALSLLAAGALFGLRRRK